MSTTISPTQVEPEARPAFSAADVRALRVRRTRRVRRWVCALGLAVVCAAAINVLLGRYTVTIPDFIAILGGERIPGASFIVMQDKLPRTITGVLVGLCFGAAGALLQRLLRNPLASPDIIGISQGASAVAVAGIVFFGASGLAVSGLAFLGALAVIAVGYAVTRTQRLAGTQFILVGLALAAGGHALISWLLSRTDIRTAADSVRWLAGSLNNATWQRIVILLLCAAVLLPLTVLAARALQPLELGDDTAQSLGSLAVRSRLLVVVTAGALCAAATAIVGPLAFVAFLAGPIARRLVPGAAVGTAALVGALIVVLADFVAANFFGDNVVPVGVVTGALGAPFLILTLITSNSNGKAR